MKNEEIIVISEMLGSLKWYFEFKNLSLRNALEIRAPLSVEDQKKLRMYYSQYFSGLVSAIDVFLEGKYVYRSSFKSSLHKFFSFNGSNGESNFLYLRELRNSIIHRGLDIASSAHLDGDFPMLIAPNPVFNKSHNKGYEPFAFYLTEMIEKCESVIGALFLNHIEEHGLFNMQLSLDEFVSQSMNYIKASNVMPENVKEMALKGFAGLDHEKVWSDLRISQVNEIKTVLTKNVM